MYTTHGRLLFIIPRAMQLFFTIIIVSLVGHIITTSYWNALPRGRGNAAEINFAMFLGVFSLVTVPVMALLDWKSPGSGVIPLAAVVGDILNYVFHLGGAIGLAAALEIHSCDNRRYTRTNRITNTARDTATRCREAQAATAFIWFNLFLFMLTTVLSVRSAYQHHKRRDHREKVLTSSRSSSAAPLSTIVEQPEDVHHSAGPAHSVHAVHPTHSVRSIHPALSAHPAQPGAEMRRLSSYDSISKGSEFSKSVSPLTSEASDTLAWIPEYPLYDDSPTSRDTKNPMRVQTVEKRS